MMVLMVAGVILLATAMMILLVPSSSDQERVELSGYLPPLDPYRGKYGPNYVLCQEPWVQMVNDTDDRELYTEIWHCKALEHSCYRVFGTTEGGYMCHGSREEPGWIIP